MEKNIAIDYLRFSITDLCNLNCMYCTPLEKSQFLTHDEILRYEEIARLVKLFVKVGIRNLRITGGEPLVKRDIIELIKMLRQIEGLSEISMTTNGVLLNDYAAQLKIAGLDRINISLDTLQKHRFKKITGGDFFDQAWKGIIAALDAGFDPVKLNVIAMKGVNDDEIADFARLTLEYPLVVRFIEFFHTNQRSEKLICSLIPSEKIKEIITAKVGRLYPAPGVKGHGPAQYLRLEQAKGSLGFISGSTTSFCHDCNRIRVDCTGKISPCLFSSQVYDLRRLLRGDADDNMLLEEIKNVLNIKPKYTKKTINDRKIEMSSLGG